MDLKIIHDLIRFFLGKEQGGWFAPEELDEMLDRAQWWFYNDQYDIYAKTQKVQDALVVFSTPFTFTSNDTGIITLPNDPAQNPCYEHFFSGYVQYYDNKHQRVRRKGFKCINEDELPARLDSQILEPTVTDPVATQIGRGILQLYPEVQMSGKGFYLRRPLKPKYEYTQTGRTINYDQANSIQLEWNGSSINKILIKALQLSGVNITDQMIIEYTDLKDKQGI